MSLMAELGEAPPPAKNESNTIGEKNRSSGQLFERSSQPRALTAPPISLPTPLPLIPNTLQPPMWTPTQNQTIPNVNVPPPPGTAAMPPPPMQPWAAMMPPPTFQMPPPPAAGSSTTAASTTVSQTPSTTAMPPPLMPPWPAPGPLMQPPHMWQPPAYPIKPPTTLPASLPNSLLMTPPPPPPPPPS